MKVSTERIPQNQIVLQIEVEPERVEKSLDAAYQRLVRRAHIPGFRKGKAPRAMLERYLGREALLQEALDALVPEVYREAIDQEEIEPIELPQVEISSTEPLVMKAVVPLRPAVELGDYKSMWIPREPVVVPEERVEEMLEQLRRRYANLNPVERPVGWNDAVRAGVSVTVDGRTLVNQKDGEFRLREGSPVLLPGFAEKLIGLARNAESEFDLTLPDDFPDETLAGRTAQVKVSVNEIKEEELPPADDAFARQVGEGFAGLEALRERLRDDLREAQEHSQLEKYRAEVLSALEETSTIDYPPVLLEKEIDRLLRDQMGPAGDAAMLERYLQRVGKSEQELRDDLRPAAEQRLRRSLLLSKLAEVENIQVDDAEISEELEAMAASAGPQADEVRRFFSSPNGREAVRGSLMTRKTWDRLVSIVSEEKPEKAAEGEAAENTE